MDTLPCFSSTARQYNSCSSDLPLARPAGSQKSLGLGPPVPSSTFGPARATVAASTCSGAMRWALRRLASVADVPIPPTTAMHVPTDHAEVLGLSTGVDGWPYGRACTGNGDAGDK